MLVIQWAEKTRNLAGKSTKIKNWVSELGANSRLGIASAKFASAVIENLFAFRLNRKKVYKKKKYFKKNRDYQGDTIICKPNSNVTKMYS